MFFELLKRFDGGNQLKQLDPIEDMEIEFDEEHDEIDIKELVNAKTKVEEELIKPEFEQVFES